MTNLYKYLNRLSPLIIKGAFSLHQNNYNFRHIHLFVYLNPKTMRYGLSAVYGGSYVLPKKFKLLAKKINLQFAPEKLNLLPESSVCCQKSYLVMWRSTTFMMMLSVRFVC